MNNDRRFGLVCEKLIHIERLKIGGEEEEDEVEGKESIIVQNCGGGGRPLLFSGRGRVGRFVKHLEDGTELLDCLGIFLMICDRRKSSL